jgi:hypothetical protein
LLLLKVNTFVSSFPVLLNIRDLVFFVFTSRPHFACIVYGSEVRSIFAVDKLQKQKDLYLNKLCTDFIAEKIHIKLCEYLLEVGCRLTNSIFFRQPFRFSAVITYSVNTKVIKNFTYTFIPTIFILFIYIFGSKICFSYKTIFIA